MNISPNQKNNLLKFSSIVIGIVCIVLCIILIIQYQQIQQLDYIAQRHSLFNSLHGAHSLTTTEASSTQTWMTFEYINRVFNLPQSYLQTTLSITDNRYPRLTINSYAQSIHASQSDILFKTQNAIRLFSTSTLTN